MQLSSREHTQAPADAYVIGADIGGTSLRLALADGNGTIVGRWGASTTGARDGRQRLWASCARGSGCAASATHRCQVDAVCAMAAGAPGVTNVDSGVVIATSYLLGWRNVPLREMLEAEFGVPAVVDNDVNLAAIGEYAAGAAQELRAILCLSRLEPALARGLC